MKCEKCQQTHDGTFATGRFCSRACANSRKFSQEAIEKKRLATIKNPPWNKGKWLVKRETRICSICNTSYITDHWRVKKYCSPECARKRPNQGGYRPNSTRKIRSEYKGYWMDSGSERTFAELLDIHGIRWIKNTDKFFQYRDLSGKLRKYYPDFYLPDYDYWVEIKGRCI